MTSELVQFVSYVGMFLSAILFVICYKLYKNQNKRTTIDDRKKARMKRKQKRVRAKYGIFTKLKQTFK